MKIAEAKALIRKQSNAERAKRAKRYFKTEPGQSTCDHRFLGLNAAQVRLLARQVSELSLKDTLSLLKSPFHEERLVALLVLTQKFENANDSEQKQIFALYLSHTQFINSWDLVDVSAPAIAGAFLLHRPRKILYSLACSGSLWKRRIAVLATYYFIKNNQYDDTLAIVELLLNDKEDLIHKAAGWMLREVGKRDKNVLISFLRKHYAHMPRTMLRYAIEKFSEAERQAFLKGTF